jgi:hypothetical protein
VSDSLVAMRRTEDLVPSIRAANRSRRPKR